MKRGVSTAGLVVFLLVDIVLVYLALRPPATLTSTAAPSVTRTTPLVPETVEPAETGAPQTTVPTGTTTSGTLDSIGQLAPRPVRILLAALDREVAWRATVGSCATGGATLSISVDGGTTWDDVEAPADTIARVQPLDRQRGFIVGGVDSCAQDQFTTEDGGRTWAGPDALVGGWARRLDVRSEVTTPQSPAATPCGGDAVIDLSRTSADQAEALCREGGVKVTDDGGVTWRDSGEAEGALAISNRLEGGVLATYVVRAGVAGCGGLQVAKVTRGVGATEVACVDAAQGSAGNVAISVAAEAGWLVVGERTWVSGADLTDWEQA